jgi:hypothetical protein
MCSEVFMVYLTDRLNCPTTFCVELQIPYFTEIRRILSAMKHVDKQTETNELSVVRYIMHFVSRRVINWVLQNWAVMNWCKKLCSVGFGVPCVGNLDSVTKDFQLVTWVTGTNDMHLLSSGRQRKHLENTASTLGPLSDEINLSNPDTFRSNHYILFIVHLTRVSL